MNELKSHLSRRAVFLDRDGVLNRAEVRKGKPYPPRHLGEFVLLPGVPEACALLKQRGFLLVVATNQPDVGRGTQTRETVEAMHDLLVQRAPIDRIEICYDAGDTPSFYRKPAPGMLLRVAADWGIDLRSSFMVGDRWRDIDCGHAAGCTTVFIDHGYDEPLQAQPSYRTSSLLDAARWIIGQDQSAGKADRPRKEIPRCSALYPYSSNFPPRSMPTEPTALE
jgi:D-glycero-D-manno-heptose 1,7-bisphosphate phosphatase